MNTVFESHRHFKIWRYVISHGQLLLRSVPTELNPRRIEVLFRNVHAMKINTEVDHLVIRAAISEEILTIGQEVGTPISDLGLTAFVIESLCSKGYVIASDIATAEDEGNYKTPSSLLIGA